MPRTHTAPIGTAAFVMPFATVIMSGMTPNFSARERRAESAEAGDDFVEDEQDAVAVADLANALEIALRRNEHAGRTGDGLDDDRGDRVDAPCFATIVLERVGELGAVRRLSARERVAREVVRVRQMIDGRQQLRRELLAIRLDAADGDAAESNAVIAALRVR